MKYYMLDLETMGTDMEADDIIQIALLELNQQSDGTYRPGMSWVKTLFTSQKPKNDWIAQTHKNLLEVSRRTPWTTPPKVRQEILGFFKECGSVGPAMLMGLNATTFDVPFLLKKGYLEKPTQNANNKLVGDYHYRIYELKGAYNLAEDVLDLPIRELFERAATYAPEIKLPPGGKHDALYDCYAQLKTLNGLIRMLRERTNAVA